MKLQFDAQSMERPSFRDSSPRSSLIGPGIGFSLLIRLSLISISTLGDSMKDLFLLGYQLAAGLSEVFTGAFLILAPVFTIQWMGLAASPESAPFLSLIGAFMLAVGLVYLYRALLVRRTRGAGRLEAVWLLTAMIRSSVAIFILDEVLKGNLPGGWLVIAIFDGTCVLIQARGLRRGWLTHAAR
jgi:hypothetical protein